MQLKEGWGGLFRICGAPNNGQNGSVLVAGIGR